MPVSIVISMESCLKIQLGGYTMRVLAMLLKSLFKKDKTYVYVYFILLFCLIAFSFTMFISNQDGEALLLGIIMSPLGSALLTVLVGWKKAWKE